MDESVIFALKLIGDFVFFFVAGVFFGAGMTYDFNIQKSQIFNNTNSIIEE